MLNNSGNKNLNLNQSLSLSPSHLPLPLTSWSQLILSTSSVVLSSISSAMFNDDLK